MLYSNMHDLLYHLVNYDHNDNHNERYELHIGGFNNVVSHNINNTTILFSYDKDEITILCNGRHLTTTIKSIDTVYISNNILYVVHNNTLLTAVFKLKE